nr:uncharacterized protein LOC112705349 [Arachis hypogaea]
MAQGEAMDPSSNQNFTASDFQNFAQMMKQFSAFQAQMNKSNMNLIQDPSSHFFLHTSENPGISLAPSLLTTCNYHAWARSVWLSLESKNKIKFVDGTLPRPNETDPTFGAWKRNNTIVLSWLHTSISPEILQSVLWCNDACELWKDLRHRFYEGDLFRIGELEEEMFKLWQGELTITAYFTKLKVIWEELDEFRPIPVCSCGETCSCGLAVMRRYRLESYGVKLLRGLNDQYATVRSQVMLMTPLPDINTIYSLLLQQERQMHHGDYSDPSMLINAVTNDYKERNGRTSSNYRGRGRSGHGRGRGASTLCSYCGKHGHTVDTCYAKHGYPPNMQRKIVNAVSVNSSIAEENVELGNTATPKGENGINIDGLFSEKQKEALIALFQQHDQQPAHSGNLASPILAPSAGIFQILSTTNYKLKNHDWILDSGATAHVSSSLTLFQSYHHINPVTIKMPNGSKIVATICGTVFFSTNLYLTNVLYVPTFSFNLISVSHATKSLLCVFSFDKNACKIQELLSSRMIGAAKQLGGLYIMNKETIFTHVINHNIHTTHDSQHKQHNTNNITHSIGDSSIWHQRL